MNRQNKFRGQRADNKEWVYGDLVAESFISPWHGEFYKRNPYVEGSFWCEGDFYEVIPETVGQYTGKKDKNGTEVYKGDVASCDDEYGLIEWDEESLEYTLTAGNIVHSLGNLYDFELEIISNIHDNPELLEVHHVD